MVLQWRVSRIYKSVSQSVHSIYEILIAIGPPMVVDPMDEPVRKKPNMDLINSINSKIGKMESASSAGNNVQPEKESREERRRKRKSRWGGQETTEKTFIPGMPTMMPQGLSKDQEEAYLRKSLLLYLFFFQ